MLTKVRRCGYYTEGQKVKRLCVDITWGYGFDRESKHLYVSELHRELKREYGEARILEVTTACPNEYGKALSPYYIAVGGKSLEDMWVKSDAIRFAGFEYPLGLKQVAFAHFYCFYARQCLPLIAVTDIFTDVFYNPDKDGLTQAEPCAILKLMARNGETDVPNTVAGFIRWYKEHVEV